MESTRRTWLHRLMGGDADVVSAHARAAAQQTAAPAPGAARPKQANFAWPQKNLPLPYTIRQIPWAKRRGARLWPNGARIAFIPQMTLEWYDFSQPQDVEVWQFSSGSSRYTATGRTNLDAVTGQMYSGIIGANRVAEHVAKLNIPFTMCTQGSFAEDHPDLVKKLAGMGWEVTDNSYSSNVSVVELSKEEQREYIKKSTAILQQVTGRKPVGARSWRGYCDENTVAVLAEEGYLYHGDLQNDELPYFIDSNGKTIVEIPYRQQGQFSDIYSSNSNPGMSYAVAYDYLRQKFDAVYKDAALFPQVITYEVFPWCTGRTEPAYVFDQFIAHVKSHPDVWIATYKDVAEWWTKQYSKGYNV